jgi:glycosyltransferase involved in cell wall biosynthesis
MKKIAFVASSPVTIKAFLMPFINELRKENQMHVIANFDDDLSFDFIPKDVIVHRVSIERTPNLLKDLVVLFQLMKLINKEKFDVVHSFTPKAGLLAQIAAFLNRTKNRYHTFTGQVWATKSGVKRHILKQMDFLTASLTSYNFIDSPSQREFLIANHVTSSKKSLVLGSGSISGVNLEKFKYCQEKRKALRDSLGLGADDFVFLYAGRLKIDKGIPELFAAFNNISKVTNSSLVLVGIDEDNLLPIIKDNKRVIFCGFTDDIAAYFSMADLLCLPSHREGFGNVIIEAAVCGLPSLGADIYGLSDAIVDRQTGLLHTVRDTKDIETKMLELYTDRVLLKDLGSKAEKRAKSFFSERLIVEEFVSFYKRKQI